MEHTKLTGLVHLKQSIIKFALNLNKNISNFWYTLLWFGLGELFWGLDFFSFSACYILSPLRVKDAQITPTLTYAFSCPSSSLSFNVCLALLCPETEYKNLFSPGASQARIKYQLLIHMCSFSDQEYKPRLICLYTP